MYIYYIYKQSEQKSGFNAQWPSGPRRVAVSSLSLETA